MQPPQPPTAVTRGFVVASSVVLLLCALMTLVVIVPHQTACDQLYPSSSLCTDWHALRSPLVLVFAISFAVFISFLFSLFSLAEAWHSWHVCAQLERKQLCKAATQLDRKARSVDTYDAQLPVPATVSKPTPRATSRLPKRCLSSDSLQRKPSRPSMSQHPNALHSWNSEPRRSSVAEVKQHKRKARSHMPAPLTPAARPTPQHQRATVEDFFFDDVPSRSSHTTSATKFYANVVYRQRLQDTTVNHTSFSFQENCADKSVVCV